MKIRVPVVSLLALAVLMCVSGPALAQEGEMMDSAMAAMMAKWEEYKTPGEPHEHFENLVGTWTTNSTFWFEPDAPPNTTTGTSEFETIFGGRYLVQSHTGNYMGESFEGMGITAYDNFLEEYIDLWIDEMGTGVYMSRGTMDEDGKVLTMTGTMPDPMSGRKEVPVRSVATHIDENTHKLEMYTVDPSGKEFKSMEIIYKRVE